MSNQLAERKPERKLSPKKQAAVDLRQLLSEGAVADRINAILGQRAPQFVASVIEVNNGFSVPVEPISVAQAAMVAASMDLLVNKSLGQAWIVPYKDGRRGIHVAQFQMGWKGYYQLAMRTDKYQRINVIPVNGDVFAGFDEIGEPDFNFSKLNKELLDDPEKADGYACCWRLTSGFLKRAFWTKQKCLDWAGRYSQAYKAGKRDSPWFTHQDDMCRKTVLMNEMKRWGVLSVEMQTAHRFDQSVIVDGQPHYVDGATIESTATPTSGLEDITANLEQQNVAAGERVNETEPEEGASPGSGDQTPAVDHEKLMDLDVALSECTKPDMAAELVENRIARGDLSSEERAWAKTMLHNWLQSTGRQQAEERGTLFDTQGGTGAADA